MKALLTKAPRPAVFLMVLIGLTSIGLVACTSPSESDSGQASDSASVPDDPPVPAGSPVPNSSSVALAAQKPANVIGKGGIVTGVNKPGDAHFDKLTVNNGDLITYAEYTPQEDDTAVGTVAGSTYNMFMLTQPGTEAQAFIVWSPDDPKWQDKLKRADTRVSGIGVPGPNTLMRGDSVQISVQPAEGVSGTDVTLDVWRDNEAVATFSFVVADS